MRPFLLCSLSTLCIFLAIGAAPAQAAQRTFTTRRGGAGRGPTVQQGQTTTSIGRYSGQPVGALHELYKHGLIVVSPFAPASLGSGARMVTTNPFPGHLAQDQANERRRPYGGIKLIGWEF